MGKTEVGETGYQEQCSSNILLTEREMEYEDDVEEDDVTDCYDCKSALRKSVFPNVPPYIRFLPPSSSYSRTLSTTCPPVLCAASGGLPHVVAECLHHAGLTVRQGQQSLADRPHTAAVWDKVPDMEKDSDEIDFAALGEDAKMNQFPGLYVIGRKDCLAKSYQKMENRFGQEHFNFHPRTFVLPEDHEELTRFMEASKEPMIAKPPNWFNGIGIKLIDKADIPSKHSRGIIQKYIDNPFLINGLKFDLRLHVLITGVNPLKIYIYEDGIVNFATARYTTDPQQFGNKFIHLTNYSINKTNTDFEQNSAPGDYTGHKWNLSTLWKYLSEVLGIDWRPVWEQTKEICLKTVLCGHQHIKREVDSQVKSEYNCYKLLGFDVFYDADLKPWLLEVNNIPSLHADTIDSFVNRPMVAEMFNIIGLTIPREVACKHQKALKKKLGLDKLGISNVGHDDKIYTKLMSEEDLNKQNKFISSDLSRDDYIENILDDISSSDARTIIMSEEELSQTISRSRIFPTPSTSPYLQFLSSPSYSDRLLDAWEDKYGASKEKREEGHQILSDLCGEKHHLKAPDRKLNPQKLVSNKTTIKDDDRSSSKSNWMDID